MAIPEFEGTVQLQRTGMSQRQPAIDLPSDIGVEMISDAAKRMMDEQIQIKAQEDAAAGKASRRLGLTEAEAKYNKFFDETQKNILMRDARQQILTDFQELQKDPSDKNIAKFNQLSQQLIDNTVNNSSKINRQIIKDNLNETLFQLNYKLNDFKTKQESQALTSEVQQTIMSNAKDLYQSVYILGLNNPETKQKFQSYKDFIRTTEVAGLSREQRKVLLDDLDLVVAKAEYAGRLDAAVTADEISKVYSDFEKNESLSPENKAEILATLSSAIAAKNSRQSVIDDYKDIEIIDGVVSGEINLSNYAEVGATLNAEKFQSLKKAVFAEEFKKIEKQEKFAKFLNLAKIPNGTMALSQADRDEALDNYIAELSQMKEMTPQDVAKVVGSLSGSFDKYTTLNSGIIENGTDPAQVYEAMQAMDYLLQFNPTAVSSLPENVRVMIKNVDTKFRYAADKSDVSLANIIAQERERLSKYSFNAEEFAFKSNQFQKEFDTKYETSGIASDVKFKDELLQRSVSWGRYLKSKAFGGYGGLFGVEKYQDTPVPASMIEDYKTIAKDFYMKGNNLQSALDNAAAIVGTTYGETNFAGSKKNVMFPIEQHVPYGATPFVKNTFVLETDKMFELSKQEFDAGRSSYYFEFIQTKSGRDNILEVDSSFADVKKLKESVAKNKDAVFEDFFGEGLVFGAKKFRVAMRTKATNVAGKIATVTGFLDFQTNPALARSNTGSPRYQAVFIGDDGTQMPISVGYARSLLVNMNPNQIAEATQYYATKDKERRAALLKAEDDERKRMKPAEGAFPGFSNKVFKKNEA